MKLFSLILSIITFFVALYFFILKVSEVQTFDEVIYVSLLGTLMAIGITGVIINWEIIRRRRKSRIIYFVSNTFSGKKSA